ncbi:MAG: acylphosphatase [Devosia sp.]
MRAVHVIVRGRVQGVGFRLFVERQAQALGLDGWVRNRRNGMVEAVIAGDDNAVERMLAELHTGPPASAVAGVDVAPHDGPVAPRFATRPTE